MAFASPRRWSAGFLGIGILASAAISLSALSACSGSNDASAFTGGDASAASDAASGTVSFAAGSTLSAAPSSNVTLTVNASADEAITFSLQGSYADASLAAATVTASGGRASIVLRTTSAAATFMVRAQAASGAVASITVSVSTAKFLTLDVLPSYSGVRAMASDTVVASIFVDATCASLSGQMIEDGTQIARGSIEGSIAISGVPSGVAVAVGARIGHYAFGCQDLGTSLEIPLRIDDRPLTFAGTDVVVDFTPTPTADENAAWVAMLARGRSRADAAFGSDDAEPGVLLDAMATAADGQMSAFASARQAGGWDAHTLTWLDAHPTLVHDQIDPWMADAENRALGDLLLHLSPATEMTASTSGVSYAAPTSVDAFDNLGPSNGAISILGPFQWVGEPRDNVTLSGALVVSASELLTLLTSPADGIGSVPAGLALGIDCTGLGAALANGTDAYAGCDGTCLGTLCDQALVAMWSRAAMASQAASDPTEVTYSASGAPLIDDTATVVQFSGTWQASVSGSTGNSTLHGTVATIKYP